MSELLSGPSFLLDWQAAELAAVNHMKTLGFIDTVTTSAGADGGIDAQSSEAAAQVKFYANPIGRPDIQRLRGAAHEYRLALFYSTGGYTKEALAYAAVADVALFHMDPYGHCEPTSDLATLLVEPEHVLERRARLEELQAVQYRFAASAIESDLKLFADFADNITMEGDESFLFSHVSAGLESSTGNFRAAIESKNFAQADVEFEEIQKRTLFLSWISGQGLRVNYADLDEAIAEGWQRDATKGSEYLLHRAGTGIFDLKAHLADYLAVWSESFPTVINPKTLIDEETTRIAGMLIATSIDPSILTPELLDQLKANAKAGVKRTQIAAKKGFKRVIKELAEFGQDARSSSVSQMLRADRLASRIFRQLDASGQ